MKPIFKSVTRSGLKSEMCVVQDLLCHMGSNELPSDKYGGGEINYFVFIRDSIC